MLRWETLLSVTWVIQADIQTSDQVSEGHATLLTSAHAFVQRYSVWGGQLEDIREKPSNTSRQSRNQFLLRVGRLADEQFILRAVKKATIRWSFSSTFNCRSYVDCLFFTDISSQRYGTCQRLRPVLFSQIYSCRLHILPCSHPFFRGVILLRSDQGNAFKHKIISPITFRTIFSL